MRTSQAILVPDSPDGVNAAGGIDDATVTVAGYMYIFVELEGGASPRPASVAAVTGTHHHTGRLRPGATASTTSSSSCNHWHNNAGRRPGGSGQSRCYFYTIIQVATATKLAARAGPGGRASTQYYFYTFKLDCRFRAPGWAYSSGCCVAAVATSS